MASMGGGGMFMPTSMQEVVDFAGLMARSDFAVPPRFRMNPGACLAVAMQALRWEMDPYAVIQKAYVANDRIAFEAQLVAAVVNTRAPIIGRMNCEYEGDGENRRCIVTATFRTETKPKSVRSPPIKQIAVKNSPLWKADPDQQLAYYTMRSFARRHCPEVLMGVYTPDEIAGIPSAGAVDVTPQSDPLKLAAQQMGAPQIEEHDPVTGEIDDTEKAAAE